MPELNVPAERLVLMPMRIETRFRDIGDKPHLWIRLYPDAVHGERHQPELTQQEQAAGEEFLEYWEEPDDRRRPAWDALAQRFGPRRAAWIVHLLREQPKPRTAAPAGATRVLPERWVALGYRGDQRLFAHWAENPVGPELRIGPALDAEPDSAAAVDRGIRWLVDFGEARATGMAMQVPLPDREGLDVLIVLGVKGTVDAQQSKQLLEELLEGHHYTDGLAFVPEGTPTNNTPDARSGFRSRDPGSETSYAVELSDQLGSGEGAPYGQVAAEALGVDATIFRHVEHAGAGRGMDAARGHMNAALWPATGGYYLTQMMAPTFSNDAVRRGRDHFVRHVRAGGLPVIRIAEHPYGVQPTAKLNSVEDRDLPQLPGFLWKLVDGWRRSLKDVPRVGEVRPGSDSSRDLLAALSVQPRSLTYRGRDVLGKEYVGALWRFLQQPLDEEWWDKGQRDVLRALRSRLNIPWTPRIEDSVVAEKYFEWPEELPIVHDRAVPWSEQNYLEKWFGRRPAPSYRHLRDDRRDGGPRRPLLDLLLRHSLLLAYVSSAARLLDGPAAPPPREEEVVEVDPDEYGETWPLAPWDLLDRRLADGTPVGRRLDENDVEDVGPVRASIRELASQPPETLEQLLAETLDLCSHRLDAWITSFARKRLDAARAQGKGILLGAYGWVEDVRPSQPSGNGRGSFVQAPSVTHANAAAILASGYLSRRNGGNEQTLAVDLSSDRVRAALWLLEGVGQGQPLGALLGYRFERRLQERQAADLIGDFRSHFPVKERPVEHEPSGPDPVVATNVVDGLSLQRAWSKTDRNGNVFGTAGVASRER